jgi:hypothetical protein
LLALELLRDAAAITAELRQSPRSFGDDSFTVGHGPKTRRIDEEKLLLHADFASSIAGHDHSVPGQHLGRPG